MRDGVRLVWESFWEVQEEGTSGYGAAEKVFILREAEGCLAVWLLYSPVLLLRTPLAK